MIPARRALILLLSLAAAGCGGGDDGDPGDDGRDKTAYDAAWLVRAEAHERNGLELARAAQRRRGVGRDVRRLANDLVRARGAEVDALTALRARVAQGGKAKGDVDLGLEGPPLERVPPQVLRNARPFRPFFLQTMLRHGQGSLQLVQAVERRGSRPEVKQVARQLGLERSREVTRLSDMLEQP